MYQEHAPYGKLHFFNLKITLIHFRLAATTSDPLPPTTRTQKLPQPMNLLLHPHHMKSATTPQADQDSANSAGRMPAPKSILLHFVSYTTNSRTATHLMLPPILKLLRIGNHGQRQHYVERSTYGQGYLNPSKLYLTTP